MISWKRTRTARLLPGTHFVMIKLDEPAHASYPIKTRRPEKHMGPYCLSGEAEMKEKDMVIP